MSWHPEPDPSILPGTTILHFFTCRSSIREDPQRSEKCRDSCTRFVNPIVVPAVAANDQPGPTVFLVVTKKFDIPTQTLHEPPSMVNVNQGNNTIQKNKLIKTS